MFNTLQREIVLVAAVFCPHAAIFFDADDVIYTTAVPCQTEHRGPRRRKVFRQQQIAEDCHVLPALKLDGFTGIVIEFV